MFCIVFADLGLPHPEERLLKAEPALHISQLIHSKGLTQTQAARMVEVPQRIFTTGKELLDRKPTRTCAVFGRQISLLAHCFRFFSACSPASGLLRFPGENMSTRVGVGFSENPDSFLAGREAVCSALQQGELENPQLLMVFATSKHDETAFLAGLRAAAGEQARIVGGSAIGVLTNDQLGYDGYQTGVVAFESDAIQFDLFREPGIAENEEVVGEKLGRQIAAREFAGEPNILLMYDSMNHNGAQPKMNMATPLLQGLQQSFEAAQLPYPPRLAGVGQCGDTPHDAVSQWFDDKVERQCAQALVFSGDVQMDTVVLHGCKPAGAYHTITKSDGPVVLEIDGRPALEVVAELLGPDSGYTCADYRFFVTLGVNKGDKFGPFREEDYANRLCCGVDEERGGLIMFEPDLVPGTEVQLMRRSVDFQYIEQHTRELLQRAAGRRPLFAFYIDCAGRASAYCGSDSEEAAEVQRHLGEIPLLGVYCGVEVARVGQVLQPLDWSGVLCLFSANS
jgi:hypothetical protein